jgi:serine protease Do
MTKTDSFAQSSTSFGRRSFACAALSVAALSFSGCEGLVERVSAAWHAPVTSVESSVTNGASDGSGGAALPEATRVALTPPTTVVPIEGAPSSFAELVETVRPGVVNIYTTQIAQRRAAPLPYAPYGRIPTLPQVERSLGSGFVVDAAGHILTNAHVIDGATSVRVAFSDQTERDAEIIGVDAATDIAVIRVEPFDGLAPLPLGDSDASRVGDWTIAVGNPFGLTSTVTAGIVSARSRRDVPLAGRIRYVDFLQTDASINPGNSGGPLIDMSGHVIGINTAINREGQGIAFAIPINMVREVLPQLIEQGRVQRGWLGVFIEDVNAEIATRLALPSDEGALVTQTVPGGPAALAGLKPGDVITRFGDEPVSSPDDLKWIASAATVGSRVPVTLRRGGAERVLDVVMGELPD